MNPPARTTGRVKKARVIFDPSDIPQPETENQRRRSARRSTASLRPRQPPASQKEPRFKAPVDLTEHLLNNKEATLSGEKCYRGFEENKCVVCKKADSTNPKNKLVSCLGCRKQTHVYCLSWHIEDVKLLRAKYKCVDCRSCHMCDAFYVSQSRNDNVVTCSKCIKTYHLTCHVPNVLPHQKLQRNWKCNKCQQLLFDEFGAVCLDTLYRIIGVVPDNTNTNNAKQTEQPSTEAPSTSEPINLSLPKEKPSTPALSTSASSTSALSTLVSTTQVSSTSVVASEVSSTSTNVQRNPALPMKLPDVTDWSSNQIAEFFYPFFPKDYQIFNKLNIDGKSLLILNREDIIGKLSPKLGISLRMYSLILKLQTGINDDKLGWA